MDQTKPIVILIMGGPASGKGTYSQKLAQRYGLIHLSIGDILREERKKETPEGKDLHLKMIEFEKSGVLMNCETVAYFLIKAMKEKGWSNNVFLIDGFVKAKPGYQYWMDKLNPIFNLKFILFLECSKATMLSRMTKRSESSGRLDDNENIFEIRLDTFFKRTYPAIELFAMHGIVRKVNTEMKEEEVMEKIVGVFESYFPEFKY